MLDMGCGVGNSTEPLLKTAKKLKIKTSVVGCDPDEYMLKEARASAKKHTLPITYVQSGAEKIPFEKETFDVIISGAAFHWFATKKALTEIKRVLKKDGMFFVFWVLSVEDDMPTVGGELYKKYKWKGIPKELRDLDFVKGVFEKSGFANIQTTKIPFVEKKTIDEELGLLKTNSTYALSSPQDKKDFMQGMKKAYTEALGKKKMHTLNQEINICYGFK